MSQYPHQKSFESHLKQQNKSASTILQYQRTLTDFFQYEHHFNETFQLSQSLSDLTAHDLQQYLNMLHDQRLFADSTINKALSNLTQYFEYLVIHHLIEALPTLALHGKALPTKQTNPLKDWPESLDAILANNDVNYYTRLFLLGLKLGFPIQRILSPDFTGALNLQKLSNSEHMFLKGFQSWIAPRQAKLKSAAYFLKQRARGQNVTITLSGLHKYLQPAAQILGMPLNPQQLRQAAIFWVMTTQPQLSTTELSERLQLSPAGVLYYQAKLLQQE